MLTLSSRLYGKQIGDAGAKVHKRSLLVQSPRFAWKFEPLFRVNPVKSLTHVDREFILKCITLYIYNCICTHRNVTGINQSTVCERARRWTMRMSAKMLRKSTPEMASTQLQNVGLSLSSPKSL